MCHTGAAVNGEPSCIRALLPKRERSGLSHGWQESDRLLLNQCPVHGHLGSAKVKVGLCRYSGGMFFTPDIQCMGRVTTCAEELAHVLRFLSFFKENSKVCEERSTSCQCRSGGRAGDMCGSIPALGFLCSLTFPCPGVSAADPFPLERSLSRFLQY